MNYQNLPSILLQASQFLKYLYHPDRSWDTWKAIYCLTAWTFSLCIHFISAWDHYASYSFLEICNGGNNKIVRSSTFAQHVHGLCMHFLFCCSGITSHGCKVINTSLQVHNHYKIEVLRSFFLLCISLSISYALNMYAIKDNWYFDIRMRLIRHKI